MAEIVLRVRLIGGDHVDVTYGDRDAAADELERHVISTLATGSSCSTAGASPPSR